MTANRTRYAHQIRKGDMPFTYRTEATFATADEAREAAAAIPAQFCEGMDEAERAELWQGFTRNTWIQVWSYGPRKTDSGWRYQWHPENLR